MEIKQIKLPNDAGGDKNENLSWTNEFKGIQWYTVKSYIYKKNVRNGKWHFPPVIYQNR